MTVYCYFRPHNALLASRMMTFPFRFSFTHFSSVLAACSCSTSYDLASECTAAVAAACFAPFFVVASPWYTCHIQPLFIYLFYITTKW